MREEVAVHILCIFFSLDREGFWIRDSFGRGSLCFWESKLENPEGVLIFNSYYFANENPAARGEDIAF